MGFDFARPTSFDEPMFTVGDGVAYYGVDHSPTYLWNSATWGISEALIPYLRTVMGGPPAWDRDQTIRKAIEIRDGVVQNPKILSFQGRVREPPASPAVSHAPGRCCGFPGTGASPSRLTPSARWTARSESAI